MEDENPIRLMDAIIIAQGNIPSDDDYNNLEEEEEGEEDDNDNYVTDALSNENDDNGDAIRVINAMIVVHNNVDDEEEREDDNNDEGVDDRDNYVADEDDDDEDNENHPDTNEIDSVEIIPDNTFDMTLSTSHSYLGNDLEVLRGRTLLDNGIYMDLPLLADNTVILFPGQTLPMMVKYDARTIDMIRKCMLKERTFGVASFNYDKGLPIGTTAEIYEYSESQRGEGVKMKAKGRQRFKILKIRAGGGRFSADVKILPEIELGPPFFEDRLKSLDCLRIIPTNDIEAKKQNIVTKRESILTPWPAWVYHNYDARRLVIKIHNYLRFVRSRGSNIPTDPIELSYWVAQNVIVKDETKKKLLKFDCAINRLQKESKILEKLFEKLFVCIKCRSKIGKQCDVFPMNMEGPQSAYCNPHGAIHETVTLYKATNIVLRREPPSIECSWFPGYAWTIACCSTCGDHKGWKFTATESHQRPKYFWGLTRASLVWQNPPRKKKKNNHDDDVDDVDDDDEKEYDSDDSAFDENNTDNN